MRWIFTILYLIGLPCGVAYASIPHHPVAASGIADEVRGIVPISSPRAPLPHSVSSNHTVKYDWATAGRLTSVTDWAGRTWTFSYDGGNRLSGIQYPNGVSHTRGYNADGQLTNLVHSKSGTPFISRSFERNLAGLKTREVIAAGLEVEPPDTWQTHTSDKADRLTGLARRDEYVIPERWRGYTPSYNQEGQVTNVSEGYRSWNSENGLVWNDAGRLVEYTGLRQTNLWTDTPPMPSWGLELGYDGLGARTVRTDELVTHRLVVDRVGRLRVPLMETDESNTAIRYYIWAPGVGLLAQIEANSTVHYVHADEIGSTLAMTDSSGSVSDQFAYSPWGELLGRTGTNTTAFTFVGGGGVTWEGGSLYKMGARYYDARLKRWLSSDPAGMAGGANLFAYCIGNPLALIDPEGKCGRENRIEFNMPEYGAAQSYQIIGGNIYSPTVTDFDVAIAVSGPLATMAAGSAPGVGQAMDIWTLTDPNAGMGWKVLAGATLTLDTLAGGLLPNAGAIRAADHATESSIVRVQHATSTTAADSIMADRQLVSQTSDRLVYGLSAEKPGVVSSTQAEILGTGARRADEVIEFDVPLNQLRRNDIGDVVLPSPVDLSGRNPVRLPIPQ